MSPSNFKKIGRRVVVSVVVFLVLFVGNRALRTSVQGVKAPVAGAESGDRQDANPLEAGIGPGAAQSKSLIGADWAKSENPSIAAFETWTGRFFNASVVDRQEIMGEGVELAKARRAELAKMIREDPERALAAAVPVMVRKDLPIEITRLLEERVSGKGDLALLGATPVVGGTVAKPVYRHALVKRKEYEAFPYGRRAKTATLTDVSILGIAVDGALAVSDSPVRLLEPGERPDGREVVSVCPVSGIETPVAGDEPLNTREATAFEVNGFIEVVCSAGHVTTVESGLIKREVVAADGGPGSSTVTGRPPYAWTHGAKKVLIIRVDFSDKTGTPVNNLDGQPITPDYAVNLFNNPNGLRDFYEQCSYGQASLTVTPVAGGVSPDVTAVLRMPGTASSYATTNNSSLLHSDARAAAQAAGIDLNSYDRIGVVFTPLYSLPGNQFTWGGLGSITGKNFWIQSQFTFGTVGHEIGHNFGLQHASSWSVTDGNPVSAAGARVEYGDVFDVMGNGSDITAQFSHWNKSILQWLPDTAVGTISTGGTYRVYRFDHAGADLGNQLALKVVRNASRDYWIGYRRATTNTSLDGGAYVVWGSNENDNGLLLDMTTPGSSVNDAALAIGTTFNDTTGGITLKPVAQGGSGADEWLDVQVTFQPRISWSKANYDVDEASGTASLTLTRSNSSTGAVSVHWATSNGTATAPSDYTASSGNVSWAAGDMSDKIINVPVVADALSESSEDFTINLSALTGGVLVNGAVATVTIIEPGVNDPGFAVEFINNVVNKVLALPDGSMIIGGQFTQFQDSDYVIYNDRGRIGRVMGTGKIDTMWGTGGGANDRVRDLARQPDGKILVAGDFTTMHGISRNRIARLNSDGSLDTSFIPGTAANDSIRSVLVQPDGKILIGGLFTNYAGTAREYLARLNSNGSLDTTFAGPDFAASGGWRVMALALQPDGKLLVGGSFYFSGGGPLKSGICRVTTTGALDSTFNGVTSGSAVSGSPGSLRQVSSIALQMDGKIVIGGSFTAFNGTNRGGIARLESTGSLDMGFAPTSDGDSNCLLVQNDGKIVAGGSFSTINGNPAPYIVRLTSTGATDPGFGAAGGFDDWVNSLAMQADGKILAGVDYTTFQGLPPAPLWRMFGGLNALPGAIQISSETSIASEGQNATLSVTRSGGSGGTLSVNYSTVAGTAGASDFTSTSGVLTWANGDSAAKTISIPISSDALVEGTETFTVNLGQALLGGALLGAVQSAQVTISDAVATSAYATWRSGNFSMAELADSNISGDQADPDHDGIVNLLEFAFNLLPRTPDTSGLPASAVSTVASNQYLTLTFRRLLVAPELTYTVETNGALPGTWAGSAVIVGSPVPNGDGTETVTYRDSLPLTAATKRFMRVKVSLAP